MDSTTEEKTFALLDELYELTAKWNEHDDVPKSQQVRAREIGEELNKIGGYPLMLTIYDEVHAVNHCACVLQAYWDNIGTWRW